AARVGSRVPEHDYRPVEGWAARCACPRSSTIPSRSRARAELSLLRSAGRSRYDRRQVNDRPPLIDVIVPNLNAGTYLAGTLDSIARNEEARAIVVDGGSTDGSLEVAVSHPGTVVVIDRTPGLSHAVNVGIERSSAPFLMWLGG